MLKLAKNLDLPLDFITERIAFLARTGAGKSGGMRVIFEQMFDAGLFSIFIDPKGDAWGIRADGQAKGKPVLIMGGDHGDVPLEATAGKVIAEFLVKERVSTVLDISDFGKADMVRFVTDLCQTLYRRNRDVVHIFIDEADMVAGEKFYDPKCLEAIQLIQNKGRHRGFGVTVATQRSAMINKTVLFASGTLIAMQTTSPKDIAVIREWLEVTADKTIAKEIVSVLPTLKTRQAIVYSPQVIGSLPEQITFDTFQTFDSMRTPKPGETRQQPKSVADIDLSAVQRDMKETIEKVKSEDPRTLKAEITRLRRELDKAQKEIPQAVAHAATKVETKIKEVPVIKDAQIEKARSVVEAIDKTVENLQSKIQVLQDIRHTFGQGLTKIQEFFLNEEKQSNKREIFDPGFAKQQRPSAPPKTLQKPAERTENLKSTPVSKNGDSELSGLAQRIVNSLAELESFGVTQPDRRQVCFYLGNNITGGHGANVLGNLRTNGFVEYPQPGRVTLTDQGRAAADGIEPPSSLDEFHSRVRGHLSGLHDRLFAKLLEIYPERISRVDLGDAVGANITGGHGANVLGSLRTAGLVEYPQPGWVIASETLFPEELA